MICEKCNCADVRIQAVSTTKRKRKGLIYWLLIGWWLEMFMWLLLTLPWLIVKIFKPKKHKSEITSMAVCQGCGYSWKV